MDLEVHHSARDAIDVVKVIRLKSVIIQPKYKYCFKMRHGMSELNGI